MVYVGGRKPWRRIASLPVGVEDEGPWRERLATEMEDVCREMLQQGLHLTHVVPVTSSRDLAGGWTERRGSLLPPISLVGPWHQSFCRPAVAGGF